MSCEPPKGFVAIVAEKPKAAEKIAKALSPRPTRCTRNGVPYWVFEREGKVHAVLPSSGHLFEIFTKKKGFPVFDYYWGLRKEGYRMRAYYLLKSLLPRASEYISACDYDVEGSLICYQIIEELGDVKRARRAKFSSLSPPDIQRAFRSLEPIDWEMAEAGRARHELDWIWGINVSRALMEAFRRGTGRRASLSAGRVQSPTLVEAVRRWRELNLFVPEPRFLLRVSLTKDGEAFEATASFESAAEGRGAREELLREGYLRVSSFVEEELRRRPPPAFNLGDLQKEAARLYGMSPARTQRIAEELYLDALISYPRTNSQKLPLTINFSAIMKGLEAVPKLSPLVRELMRETGGNLRPVQGKEDDPAHPAIHPTGEVPPEDLKEDHWKIYELVVRRFLAAFASNAALRRRHAELVDARGRKYVSEGLRVTSQGWMKYYPYDAPQESLVPLLSRGELVRATGAELSVTWGSPRQRISKISLVKWMEEVGIGTEATRAERVEVLYSRGYLSAERDGSVVTELGYLVARVLQEAFPELSSVELTRRFEERLTAIREGRAGRAEVIREAQEAVGRALEGYSKRLAIVAERLSVAAGVKRAARTCLLCEREAASGPLCEPHAEALARLRSSLPGVAERLGVSREEALEELSRRAGGWVREVAVAASKRKDLGKLLL
ncbi:MAG: DNA topoisomerase I [Acidilobaceae archaeon]|nr:DNA topoisomerase I [Acidilobaceae archaeon]